MKKIICSLVLIPLVIFPRRLPAADFQGADALLKQVAATQELRKTTPDAGNADTPGKLRADLAAFRATVSTLPPDDAARRWLGFAERYSKFSRQSIYEASESTPYEQFNFRTVVESLPPPAAWDDLAKAIDRMPASNQSSWGVHTILLRFMAHKLTQNTGALKSDFEMLRDLLKKSGRPEHADEFLSQLKTVLAEDSGDGEEILKGLNELLGRYEKQPSGRNLAVPDLVSLVGEEKAAAFLHRALVSNIQVAVIKGDETKKLARKIAAKNVDSMKVAQWSLADSIDSTALFEGMEKRFKNTPGDTHAYKTARTCYLLGLIAAHRTKEAAEFAIKLGADTTASLPESGIRAFERAGLTVELADFLHDLLSRNPDLPFWSDYTELAVKAGQQEKMVALVETAAARPDLDEKKGRAIRKYLSDAYLAVGRVDEGVAILRKQLEGVKKETVDENAAGQQSPEESGEHSAAGLGLSLARLGAVLERNDLVDEGINAVRGSIKAGSSTPQRRRSAGNAVSLASFLVEQGRGVEAESVLGDALVAMGQPSDENYDSSGARDALVLLLDIYHQAGRPADVLALLDHAAQWNTKDLADVFSGTITINRNEEYVGYFAASALIAQGQKDKARKILDALMDAEGGYDPAYELLIKLAPREDTLARLDALFARDKYEPRPLIWKAKLLLDAGKAEEAETVAKQAVAIDPSDGEHGPGRRMRVYSVLADIREARGDKKEAEFLRGAVTAIRHSENADRFYEVGLISQAVKMYEEALTHFSDAYCIQSRLALRMAEIGDMAGAEEHYRRAYELMPDSFGRVESHCFGCERAFAGEHAQGIAERVFTKLAKERPEKPQVHYLLGYLRYEQDRYRDALPEFREAVKLDPEYLNAWKKIAEIGGELSLPPKERDAVQINLLRLDPLGRHSSFESENIAGLAAAWTAMETASKLQPAKPRDLYPLAAAAEEIAKPGDAAGSNRIRRSRHVYRDTRGNRLDPGNMVASNKLIEAVTNLMESYGQLFVMQPW